MAAPLAYRVPASTADLTLAVSSRVRRIGTALAGFTTLAALEAAEADAEALVAHARTLRGHIRLIRHAAAAEQD